MRTMVLSRNEQNGLPQVDAVPIEGGNQFKIYEINYKENVNSQSKNEKSVILCPFLLMCYTMYYS